jgi:hypothetical protein
MPVPPLRQPLGYVASNASRQGDRRCERVRLAAPRGFEPRLTDPKSAVLPLDEGAEARSIWRAPARVGRKREWSGRRDSNPRPSPWQGDALPTEPLPLENNASHLWCREPGSNWRHRDFQSRALPTELSRPDLTDWLPVGAGKGTTPDRNAARQPSGSQTQSSEAANLAFVPTQAPTAGALPTDPSADRRSAFGGD